MHEFIFKSCGYALYFVFFFVFFKIKAHSCVQIRPYLWANQTFYVGFSFNYNEM
uniref:Uncharacterized protein n=2 Tax=Gammaproteobacteria TaxID=1236 RepID=A0A514C8X0_MORMO|nr:hypothetical protein [Morganella morganii]QDX15388.1 hypothetical protein [Actinobacillus pleuropneumoniae]